MAGESKLCFAPLLGKQILLFTILYADNHKNAWLSYVALRSLHPSDEDTQRVLRSPTLVRSCVIFTDAVLIIRQVLSLHRPHAGLRHLPSLSSGLQESKTRKRDAPDHCRMGAQEEVWHVAELQLYKSWVKV